MTQDLPKTNSIPQDNTDPALDNNNLANIDSAIKAALSQNWDEAIKINLSILKYNKNNIDTLNRLGFAYIKTGNQKEAKKTLEKVKTLDPYNQIAEKNLIKLENAKKECVCPEPYSRTVSPMMFLEDPGKTKIIQLVNVAPSNVLLSVHCGQEVNLKIKNHCIEIRDGSNQYLGALPDDISFKLTRLIEGKNIYHVIVKCVDKNSLTVMVREIFRGKKFSKQPSFLSSSSYMAFGRDSIADQGRPDTAATGEELTED